MQVHQCNHHLFPHRYRTQYNICLPKHAIKNHCIFLWILTHPISVFCLKSLLNSINSSFMILFSIIHIMLGESAMLAILIMDSTSLLLSMISYILSMLLLSKLIGLSKHMVISNQLDSLTPLYTCS